MSPGAAAHSGEPRGSATSRSAVEESADGAGTTMEGLGNALVLLQTQPGVHQTFKYSC